jgi:leucyl aminopeptidase (aminopeptidase T)
MDTVESVLWLKKNNLFNRCASYAQKLKVVFTECLQTRDEDVLVIGDTGLAEHQVAPIFAGACFLAARALNHNAKLVFQDAINERTEEEVKKHLERVRPESAIVLATSGKIGSISKVGKPFKQLCKEKRLRYTSTPSLGTLKTSMIDSLVSSVCLDYASLRKVHGDVKRIIDAGDIMHIRTKAGTDLSVPIKGCTAVASDGLFTRLGYGGNLPAGEVFIAPMRDRVSGKVVIDCSSRNRETTMLIKEPITLIIENGEVKKILGGKEARALEQSLIYADQNGKNDWGHRMIGEVGIGLNPNAKVCGSMIIDEKVMGTAHVALGSNHWFGGNIYSSIHLDQVFKNPEITVDGRLLRF